MLDRVRVKSAGSVGPTVGRLILRSSLTETEVAAAAGVTTETLRKWSRGIQGLTGYNMYNVLDALGYDLVFEKREGGEK